MKNKIPDRLIKIKTKRRSFSKQPATKKLIVLLLALLLLTLPAFAVANTQALQQVAAQIQEIFNGPKAKSANQEEVLSAEAGIAALESNGQRVIDVAFGRYTVYALREDGTLWGWGANWNDQLGTDDGQDRTVPIQIGSDGDWIKVDTDIHAELLVIKNDGTLWSYEGFGGDGFIQIGTDDTWENISVSNHNTLATQKDGSLWAWGYNNNGQLGLGDTVDRFAPTQVGSDRDWKSISAGSYSIATKHDGTLWHWGLVFDEDYGTNILYVPTQLGNDSDWNIIFAGPEHSLATKNDGTLWAWGAGYNNQLGLGADNSDKYIPTQVGTRNDWIDVAADEAISTAVSEDGSVWMWGQNIYTEWYFGEFAPENVPTRVEYAGKASRALATMGNAALIQEDGSIWMWGRNDDGALAKGIHGGYDYEYYGDDNRDVDEGRGDWIPWRVAASLAPAVIDEWTNAPDATIPNDEAVDVSLDTNVLTIRFDREMRTDAASLGAITLNNGARVDLTQAVWSSGTHPGIFPAGTQIPNSVLTVPLTLVRPGALHTATISGFIDAQFGVRGTNEMYPHTWTFTTDGDPVPDPSMADLTKTLTLPEGTTVPSPSFTFNFTPQQVVLDDSVTPNINSRPTSDFATLLSNQTITLSAADAVTENGTTTITGSLDIAAILSKLTFPGGGVYVWNVSEVAGSSNTSSPSHMSYDDSLYQIRAWVNRDGELDYIAIHKLERGEGSTIVDLGKTEEGINFFNSYRRQTGTNENPALKITKEVIGDMANLNTLFNFTVTLEAHALAPITNTPPATLPTTLFSPRIVDAAGATVSRAITVTPGANNTYTLNFQLKHGETLEIPTLPAGTTFTTTEAAANEYAPSATVTAGGVKQGINYAESPNTTLSTKQYLVEDKGSNSADFINAHNAPPHTGLVVTNNIPLALVVSMGLLLVVMLALRNRQRIERIPL